MTLQHPFSKRNRYVGPAKEITIRVLRKAPDEGNWSEYPNIWGEVQGLMYGCDWFKVYDAIEELYAKLRKHDRSSGDADGAQFEKELNEFFVEEGIGWQLVDGQNVTRGTEAFEAAVTNSATKLDATNRPTAAKHLHEALQNLSRRPDPDLHGAIYHAMGRLEAVARDVIGDQKATLGQILKRYPLLVPAPLDAALSQIWGYASNEARHVQEGKEPKRSEAELIVGLAAALAGYLTTPTEGCFI
jgi:AbiJ N-terminal domain 4